MCHIYEAHVNITVAINLQRIERSYTATSSHQPGKCKLFTSCYSLRFRVSVSSPKEVLSKVPWQLTTNCPIFTQQPGHKPKTLSLSGKLPADSTILSPIKLQTLVLVAPPSLRSTFSSVHNLQATSFHMSYIVPLAIHQLDISPLTTCPIRVRIMSTH